jgi:hypothetical protein
MDPFVNPPNIIVDYIGTITLEPNVGLHTITNTSAPRVVDLSPSSPKTARLEKSTKGDLDFEHTPISQYLRHPRPMIFKVGVGSRLIVVATSMNHFQPPIKDLSTHQVSRRKRPIIQTIITFVGEHNYEQPHINDGILDIKGQHPTN